MKVTELTTEEKRELKERYYMEKNQNVSYGELATIDKRVTDKEIFEYFENVNFVKDDFFCNINKDVE